VTDDLVELPMELDSVKAEFNLATNARLQDPVDGKMEKNFAYTVRAVIPIVISKLEKPWDVSTTPTECI